ncbi:MAG TPA: D-arabinono-1,4-lactone oxidase [Jiangellaceae bacterium]|nr:D-arabinono-1,4-lactone oxidase [Jiangellaceae bacterium]
MMATHGERNWAGNHRYRAKRLRHPRSVEQLAETVARAHRVRALGSRHSFNDIGDTVGDLISLAALPARLEVDDDRRSVTVSGGTGLGSLATSLERRALAVHNLASLPHISVAGACATATHGSGDGNQNLSASVSAVELVTGSGDLRWLSREKDPDIFPGVVVSLGALGVVTALTLDVQPSFRVRQDCYVDLPWEDLLSSFEQIMGRAYSVSVFTGWADTPVVDQVWLKTRLPEGDERVAEQGLPQALFGAVPARTPRHPLPGMTGHNCTEQLGVPGAWCDRLPHFRMEYAPSGGDEVQSEYLVPRHDAVRAIEALRAIAHQIRPVLQVCEIRTVAADGLWLSPSFDTDVVGFHFTWVNDQSAIEPVLPVLEETLAPFSARPHWAKLFHAAAADLAPLYPKLPAFRELVSELDPQGTFSNDFLDRRVIGTRRSLTKGRFWS